MLLQAMGHQKQLADHLKLEEAGDNGVYLTGSEATSPLNTLILKTSSLQN